MIFIAQPALRRWLRRQHDEMDVTSVFVTHDQEEAMEVADRIVVMNHGRLGQPAGQGGDVAFVRPHELDIVAGAAPGSIAATLVHALTVGPNTRLEFRRDDDQSHVDVEMARSDWQALRDRLGLGTGSRCTCCPSACRASRPMTLILP